MDEPPQTDPVHLERFGEGEGLTSEPRQPLTQRVDPPFDVRRLSRFLAHRRVLLRRNDLGVRFPEVAVAVALTERCRDRGPQRPTGRFTPVSDRSPTAHPTICRVPRHNAIQTQTLFTRFRTKLQSSSSSNNCVSGCFGSGGISSSSSTGIPLCSSTGTSERSPFFLRFLSTLPALFQPGDHRRPRDPKGPGQPSQAAPFVIGPQDLGFALGRVAPAPGVFPTLAGAGSALVFLLAVAGKAVLHKPVASTMAT